MKVSFLELIKERTVLLDGANGSELIKRGLPKGLPPEAWNVEEPQLVKKVHQEYFAAGSDAVLTNTFGGNALTLASYGLEKKLFEINFQGAQLACQVKPDTKFVGGDIGPTGKFLKPYGPCTPEELEKVFYEQASVLVKGGVDFLIIETMFDLREAIAAVKGAKNTTDLPIFTSLTFNKTKKGYFTLMGNSVEEMVEKLEKEKVNGIGVNCTLNSEQMLPLVEKIRTLTSLPLIAQANAGQPRINPEGNLNYEQPLEEYIQYIPAFINKGVNIIGGCCGTTPEYIKKIAEIIHQK